MDELSASVPPAVKGFLGEDTISLSRRFKACAPEIGINHDFYENMDFLKTAFQYVK